MALDDRLDLYAIKHAHRARGADEARGVSFYELFIDRSHWPRLMRQAYEAARGALAAAAAE